MSDQALPSDQSAADPPPSPDSFAPSDPSRLTRYERRSGSLPHLEDQSDVDLSLNNLPTPVASGLRPLDRLRSLIGN